MRWKVRDDRGDAVIGDLVHRKERREAVCLHPLSADADEADIVAETLLHRLHQPRAEMIAGFFAGYQEMR